MNSKDELLAKLRAIDAESPGAEPEAEPELKAVSPPMSSPDRAAGPEEISKAEFLAQLAALDEATRPAPTSPPASHRSTPAAPQPSSQVSTPSASGAVPPTAKPPTAKPPTAVSSVGSSAARSPAPPPLPKLPTVIERLKQFTQAQLAAHAAENRAKAKRQKEIECAQAWLDQLDPLSDDGFWFEQFAESYESRIEAALVFLNPGSPQP